MGRRRVNPDGSPHIKRPQNAWILFRSHWQNTHRESFKGMEFGEVSKAIGKVWRSVQPEERAVWVKLEEKAKVEHALRYPGYKFKPKQSDKKPAKGQEKKEDTKQERPRKRRRMGDLLTNSTMEIPLISEGEVASTSSIVPQEESFPLAGPSSNVSTEVPAVLEEGIHVPSSFAEYDQQFKFYMPHVPSAPELHFAHQGHGAADSDPNSFRFDGDYEWPAAGSRLAHQAHATTQNYLNAFQLDSGYESHAAQFHLDHQSNATTTNDVNTYHVSAGYDFGQSGQYSSASNNNYTNFGIHDGSVIYETYHARLLASTYRQHTYEVAT